ncbi:WD40 domain-containing protein [Phormidesmis priestleyi]
MTIDETLQTIERLLPQGHLTKIQTLVLQQSWAGQSYMEIAREFGYDPGYIKDTGAKLWQQISVTLGEKVTKQNFKGVLNRAVWRKEDGNQTSNLATQNRTDWGDAIDVSIFHGRTQELATLQTWIAQDRCRLVTLLGMGGMGKTSLSIKLAEEIQNDFECLIWRSLRDAPPLDELLTTLIQVLSQHQDTDLPNNVGDKLSRLIELLKRSRCLIILDNFETVLQSGKRAGTYRNSYEMYGELLKRVGEIAHQSCLVLTSREKPQEVGTMEGDLLPIRTLPLVGLDVMAGQHILDTKGLYGAVDDREQLVAHYRGNPLALKMAATSIQDLFAGDIAQFLEQGTVAFNGIGNLLQQQCDRLTPPEQAVMNWLALNREPVTLADLQADLVTELPKSKLMEVLESLRWRSLIESSAIGFTQQPVVMESVTESLIEQMANEIVAEQPQVFLSHALIKAQVKDYIRDSQIRVILQPLLDRLLTQLGSPKQLEHKLNRLLTYLQTHCANQPNYGAGNLLNLFRQLETDLTGYDFSSLSIRQAYLQDVNLHQVNFTAAEFVNCAFASTFGGVTSVAFSPDGNQLATSDTNGSIQIWSLRNGKQLALCAGHNSWVWNITYSPSQPMLASCGQDHQVRLWDSHTGQCLKLLEGHTGIVTSVTFSFDGQWLASTSGDQTIRLWNVATGQCVQTLQGHAACVWSAVFHPDGQTLFSAGEDNVIRRWQIESGQCVQTLTGHQHWVKTIALSLDGQRLVSGSYDQTLKLWDIQTGSCLATLSGHHKPVTSVALSFDGRHIASSSYDQTVKLWCLASQQCLQTLQKHTNFVWSVAFHPTLPLLASGGEDYTARLWDLQTGQCTKTLQGHSNSIYTIALSSHQNLLASGHEDQTIKLWDFNLQTLADPSPHLPFRTLRGHTGRVLSIAFSLDDQMLASASLDRTIRLWNPHTGHCSKTLHGHTSWVWAIAFHPDSKQIASASYDHTIKLWDVNTGDCLHTLKEHTSSVLSVAFSPDGYWLVSGGYEQTIKLWHSKTGQCLHTLQAHLNRVWAVAFSPDSRWLATGGDDRTVKLWDVATGQCIRTFAGHTSQVLSLSFNADGTRLISSSADKTIRIWNVVTGDCTAILQGHQNWVWSLQLNDKVLLSGSQDETIKVWLEAKTHLKTLRCPRPYEGASIKGATGLTEAQKLTLQALGASKEIKSVQAVPF